MKSGILFQQTNPTFVFFKRCNYIQCTFFLVIHLMAPRLDEESQAVVLLWKKFRGGEFSKSDDAKTIKDSAPLFQEFNQDSYRTIFNRLKKGCFDVQGNLFTLPFTSPESVELLRI